jgi:hypothetical protein
MIQNARLPMQIDVGFGDVIHPVATTITYPTMLDFEAPNLIGYPKETVIAEKFEAMVKLGQLNSRMKDFFDVCVLARQFDFDAEILSNAVQKTFANRGTELLAEPYVFSEPFRLDATKQIQWTAFIRKSKLEGTWDSSSYHLLLNRSLLVGNSLRAGRRADLGAIDGVILIAVYDESPVVSV